MTIQEAIQTIAQSSQQSCKEHGATLTLAAMTIAGTATDESKPWPPDALSGIVMMTESEQRLVASLIAVGMMATIDA